MVNLPGGSSADSGGTSQSPPPIQEVPTLRLSGRSWKKAWRSGPAPIGINRSRSYSLDRCWHRRGSSCILSVHLRRCRQTSTCLGKPSCRESRSLKNKDKSTTFSQQIAWLIELLNSCTINCSIRAINCKSLDDARFTACLNHCFNMKEKNILLGCTIMIKII